MTPGRWAHAVSVTLTLLLGLTQEARGQALVAAYGFDEADGALVVDHAGYEDTGFLADGAIRNRNGKFLKALELNGQSGGVDLGPVEVGVGGMALTLTAWFKADDFGIRDARIIDKSIGTSREDHYWMVSTIRDGGRIRLRFRLKTTEGGTTMLLGAGNTVTAGVWTHVAAVYDGAGMKLYQDGVLVASTPKSGLLVGNPDATARIGDNPVAKRVFDGLIDNVRLYAHALDEDDIAEDMGTPGNEVPAFIPTAPPAPTLVASYAFDEPGGARIIDHAGADDDAWLENGAARSPNGKYGHAVELNGVSGRVDLGTLEVGAGGYAFAATAWFKADDFGIGDARIIDKSVGTSSGDHYWMVSTIRDGGRVRLRFRLKTTDHETTTLYGAGGTLSPGQWTHVAAVYDGERMSLFQNATLVGSTPKTGRLIGNSNATAKIGDNPVAPRVLDGLIDNVRLYAYPLDAEQVAMDMATPADEVPEFISGRSPLSPSNLVAAASSESRVDLSWTDNSNDETGFEIHRSTAGVTGPYLFLANVPPETALYSDLELAPLTEYCYRVRALGDHIPSAYTTTRCATTYPPPPPTAPSNLTATALSPHSIHVAWSDNSDDETGFEIERSTGGVNGRYQHLTIVPTGSAEYVDPDLDPATVYCYRVRALNGNVPSGDAPADCAATDDPPPPTAPPAPENLVTTVVSATEIHLTWIDTSQNVAGFEIERSVDGLSGNYQQIAIVPAGTAEYEDPNLSPAMEYCYRVWAQIGGVSSASASAACGTTDPAPAVLETLTLGGPTSPLWPGAAAALTVTGGYSDGTSGDVTAKVSWSNAAPGVVQITPGAPASVTAISPGSAMVFAGFLGVTSNVLALVVENPPAGPEALIFVRGNQHNLWDIIPRDRSYVEDDAHADIMRLEPVTPTGTVTNLTNLPNGAGAVAFTPHVTPDAQTILFAMRDAWDSFYQIYRMRTDGSELTQLTFPPSDGSAYDNINPVVAGGGRIAFLSNRDFIYDEYGKRNQMNLYTMDADGSRQTLYLDGLSGNYDLNCFSDGSLVFSRWDYRPLMNKLTCDNFSLWRMNTDGSDLRVFWGLYFLTPRPGNHGIQDWRRAHELPDGRMVCIGGGRVYHQHNYGAGFIATVGPVETVLDSYTNITPDVPESADVNNQGRYLEAVPWGTDKLLVVYSEGPVAQGHQPEPNWDLYSMNLDGSQRQLLLADGSYHLAQPRFVAPRPAPPFVSSSDDPEAEHGVIACDDVFTQNMSEEIGSLHRVPHETDDPFLDPVTVRIMEGFILKKTSFYSSQPRDTTFISDVKSSLAYRVLGEVPIHSDGSFAARVPANRPILFQTLNSQGQAIVTMPFWTMVAPGESKRCLGCHDPQDGSMELAPTTQALQAPLVDCTDGEVFDFQDDVTPFLAAKCGGCHSGENPPAGMDLSADRTLFRNMAYRSLSVMKHGLYGLPDYWRFSYLASKLRGLGGVDSFLLSLVGGTLPYDAHAEEVARLTKLHPTHAGLLTLEEQRKLAQWCAMPTLFGTPFYRYVPEGETDLHDYPQPDMDMWDTDIAPMLVDRCRSCHDEYPSSIQIPEFTTNTIHNARSANVNHQTFTALLNRTGVNCNFDHPEWSPILKLGLGGDGHPAIFSSAADPDYQALLEWIRSGN